MSEHRVASVEDVPEGGGIAVDVGDRRIAIFRYRDVLFALDETCPHRGAPLHQGTITDGIVMCPWHQWRFELETGCSPVNPLSKVSRYPVRVVDGGIWITV
jgi:NAD(P)H-dependent nitrite reductase small subunit